MLLKLKKKPKPTNHHHKKKKKKSITALSKAEKHECCWFKHRKKASFITKIQTIIYLGAAAGQCIQAHDISGRFFGFWYCFGLFWGFFGGLFWFGFFKLSGFFLFVVFVSEAQSL